MNKKKQIAFILTMFFCLAGFGQQKDMVLIKGGIFAPQFGGNTSDVAIASFMLDIYPVSNADYIQFLKENPKWRKSKIIKLFADEHYLEQFQDDLTLNKGESLDDAVTNVSWYAAKEYCKCQGKRLPLMDEWEYAGMADQVSADARDKEEYNQLLIDWYEKSKSRNRKIGSTFKNYWGVYDMHGLVWEWTADFNSVLLSQDARNGSGGNNNLFCGGAALGANDLKDYAAFMRYAFRSSLKANYSVKNLGFRCAKSIK